MSNRDGILDSHPSERVTMPPDLAALDRWAADQNDTAKWEALMAALAPALAPDAGADELKAARLELALADDGQPRAAARRKLAVLVKARRPLPASASFRPASHITDPLPRPILRASGMDGAVLAEGAVCLLSGEGGAAKSTLATTVALDLAYGGQLIEGDGLAEGFSRLFDVRPGAVMVAGYEDPAGVVAWRLRELAAQRGAGDAILARVHVAHFAGLPLWGTPADGHYNAPPVQLRGWERLWEAADRIRPALVVIDPALDAYTGDPNNLPAVREFVSALAAEARARACGVPAGRSQPQGRQGQGRRPLRPRPGGRGGSLGRRSARRPDLDRSGRRPHPGDQQGELGPRLRPDAALAGCQRERAASRIRRGERWMGAAGTEGRSGGQESQR